MATESDRSAKNETTTARSTAQPVSRHKLELFWLLSSEAQVCSITLFPNFNICWVGVSAAFQPFHLMKP